MERLNQQMKKGVLELLVLAAVAEAPAYGYQLITSLEARSGGLFALKEGTLYPVLYRLEDEGLLQAGWQEGEGRAKPKKYYHATPAGKEKLKAWRGQWRDFSATVQAMLDESEKKEVSA